MRWKAVGSVLFVAALCAMVLWGGPAIASVTPESVKAWFDAQWVIIGFALGLIIKYIPWFAKLSNQAIGWINVISQIAIRLFSGGASVAHADGLTPSALLDVGGVIVSSFTSSVWARQAYEMLGRPLLEHLFGWKKAVPKATQ